MFEDVKIYERQSAKAAIGGKKKCSDNPMFIAIGALDFDDDLLDAMEHADRYLLDEESLLAA